MDEQKYNLDQSKAELDKLVDLSAEETDKTACEALAEKARIIYEQFPESEEIALQYAMILFNLSTEQAELKELETTAEKLRVLQQKFQDSHDIAKALARILVNLSIEQTDLKELEISVEKLKILQQQFQDSYDIALQYAMILFNLSIKQTMLKELETTAEKLRVLQQKFQDSHDIAKALAMILVNLSTKQTELKERKATAEKLEKLQQQFQESHDIAEALARILFNLSTKQTETDELERTAEKLEKLHEKFPVSEDIASQYAKILVIVSTKQTETDKLERTVGKLEKLHDYFSESQLIAEALAMILAIVSTKQTEADKLERTVGKLEKLHDYFFESQLIAEVFAMILVIVSTKRTEADGLERISEKLEKLHEKFPDSEDIASQYAVVLTDLFDYKIETTRRHQITETIKNIYRNFSSFLLQSFNDLFFHNDCVYDSGNYKLFKFILKTGLLKNTQYAILENWINRYDEDSEELKNLLSIYQHVQKIKYQLGLKDQKPNDCLKFGHYTKGSTLQIMLNQKENGEKQNIFSVSGKTRLYNANYMNDPEEGLVIEEMLEPKKKRGPRSYFWEQDFLNPSSWFLMSFTIKTDDLAMWSQYGDDAKGVCLILRENDFSRFTSFNDVSWRKETIFSESESKTETHLYELSNDLENLSNESEKKKTTVIITGEEKESEYEKKENVSHRIKDYLYRIAYVKNTGDNFELEQTELFEKSELDNLEKLLIRLKDELKADLSKLDPFYKKAVYNCIEEIRYLFKSVDYKYENELRILRYASLDPSNDKIKIDKESGIGKLYVERENPIQIEEVIFGPKFPNPEYVTPLLKLLDKDINYKKSTIKFR